MNYSAMVDELGELKARISELTKQEAKLKAALFESGYPEIDGDLYRATVTWTTRETLESEKVRALLTPAQIGACTKTSEVITVRVVARKRAAA
jgi:hypothetical protein